MAYEFIKYEQDGPVVTITLNRPERMNAIHHYTSAELSDAWHTFRDDDSAWIGVLTGAGDRAFSAGNDLKFQAETVAEKGVMRFPPVRGGFGGMTGDFECWKPMIAAVNGFALGGGLELALACDIIVASENAKLGLPEPTVGLIAGAGGVHRLPRQIPYHIAMGFMFTAKHVSAAEAHRWGLVNEVVPQDELMDAVKRWTDAILKCSPLAIRATKEAVNRGRDMREEVATAHNFPAAAAMAYSEDFIEGPLAFAEKRPPQWKGR